MQFKAIFVERSHGSFEGSNYDNVILSDGLMAFKVVNKTTDDTVSRLKEGDEVLCTFSLKGSKSLQPKLDLVKITVK